MIFILYNLATNYDNIFSNVIQKYAFFSTNLELRKKKIIERNGRNESF